MLALQGLLFSNFRIIFKNVCLELPETDFRIMFILKQTN